MPDQPVVGDERGDAWAGQALVVPTYPGGWQQGAMLAVRSVLSGFQNWLVHPLGKAVLWQDAGLPEEPWGQLKRWLWQEQAAMGGDGVCRKYDMAEQPSAEPDKQLSLASCNRFQLLSLAVGGGKGRRELGGQHGPAHPA